MIYAMFLALAAGVPVDPPAAGSLPVVMKAEPDAALTAKFRRADGWVGGDGAFSVSLSDKRTLWLFSDTWVGTIRDGKRKDVAMVNNTVGVQEGSGTDMKLTFAIQKTDGGKPTAIFTPLDGKGWFWQFAGHHADGKLHVFLPRFEKAAGPAAFGFKSVDLWLGSVSNPLEDPTKWKTAYTKVPFAEFGDKRKRAFGSAVLVSGDHAYVYGYEERQTRFGPMRDLLVARVATDKLADFSKWQFRAADGWKPEAIAACGFAGGLGAEFSVSYLPDLKRYALVTTENGLSDRIVGRFATSPEGPWSDPVLLYTCPEIKKDKKVFSYAAKAHPHLGTGNELVISYVVNAFEFGPVINNAELYWPTFVRVQLK